MFIEIYAGESGMLNEALEARLACVRGDFPAVLDYLPARNRGEDWGLCVDAVCQLLSLHTIENVDGITKVLYDPWDTTLELVNKAVGQVNLIEKLAGRQYLSIEMPSLRAIVTSLRLLLSLKSGQLEYFFQVAPFDYNNNYTRSGLDDWTVTKMQVYKILSPLIYNDIDAAYIVSHIRLLQRLDTIHDQNVKLPVNRTPAF